MNDGSRDGSERVVQQYIDRYGRDLIRLVNYKDGRNQGKVRLPRPPTLAIHHPRFRNVYVPIRICFLMYILCMYIEK